MADPGLPEKVAGSIADGQNLSGNVGAGDRERWGQRRGECSREQP
ncbi:hypothetical protein [Citricoccus sp. GCM10030269]